MCISNHTTSDLIDDIQTCSQSLIGVMTLLENNATPEELLPILTRITDHLDNTSMRLVLSRGSFDTVFNIIPSKLS